MSAIRVLVVDDQRLLADALCLALRREGLEPDLAPVTGRDDLVSRVRADPPALVLLDLDLGGALGDGADLVAPCVAAGARVLVLTGTKNEVWIAAALEQGACAAVDKAVPFDDLLRVVLVRRPWRHRAGAVRTTTPSVPAPLPSRVAPAASWRRSSRSPRASNRCCEPSRPG